MAILITRTVVVPVWLLVCALVVAWSSPPGMVAMGLLVLTTGLAGLAIVLLGRHAAHAPAGTVVQPKARADRPSSWPDSGFRNIGRGTKGG